MVHFQGSAARTPQRTAEGNPPDGANRAPRSKEKIFRCDGSHPSAPKNTAGNRMLFITCGHEPLARSVIFATHYLFLLYEADIPVFLTMPDLDRSRWPNGRP